MRKTTYERHGQAGRGKNTDLYRAWARMRNRCLNVNDYDFHYYGGRGITIYPGWENFTVFARDMGPFPGSGWTLDRIDTNGDYEPTNCRWATRKTQGRNTRQATLTEEVAAKIRKLYGPWKWKGKPQNGITQAELARRFGVTQTTVSKVLTGRTWG